MLNSKDILAYLPLKKDYFDYSGKGQNGTPYNTVLQNNECIFNGVNSKITLGIIEPKNFTLSVKIKFNGLNGYQVVFRSNGQDIGTGFALGTNKNVLIAIINANSATYSITTLITGKVYHIVWRKNRNKSTFIINNIIIAEYYDSPSIIQHPTSGNRTAALGVWVEPSYPDWLNATMSDFLIFNRPLSDNDIKRLSLNLHPIQ